MKSSGRCSPSDLRLIRPRTHGPLPAIPEHTRPLAIDYRRRPSILSRAGGGTMRMCSLLVQPIEARRPLARPATPDGIFPNGGCRDSGILRTFAYAVPFVAGHTPTFPRSHLPTHSAYHSRWPCRPIGGPAVPRLAVILTIAWTATIAAAQTTAKGNWPQFRGPAASGIADGANTPTEWDVSDGTNILWKTPVPGLAHSSPIVWGDCVFVTTAVPSTGDTELKVGL